MGPRAGQPAIGPVDRRFDALVTERSCASGSRRKGASPDLRRPASPASAPARVEHGRPWLPPELWHIDLKGPFFFVGATGLARTCHFVALGDDNSRFMLRIRAVPTKEAAGILALLEEAIELCGVPHELMTDNETPFVAITRLMLSRFQRSLAELSIRQIRTQIDTPWTNGKIEAFWATLQSEVLDRQQLADLAAAEDAVTAYAGYYNYHRLQGELDRQTPAEPFDGTPFTDRGFGSVPSLPAWPIYSTRSSPPRPVSSSPGNSTKRPP